MVCTVRNVGSVDAPRLELTLEPPEVRAAQVAAVERTLARVLGLDEEPGFTVPGADDPRLGALARALRGTRRRASRPSSSPSAAWCRTSSSASTRARCWCGVKIRTLRHLASLVSTGALREEDLERLPTGAAQRLLDALPGIGPWSAAVVLLRGLRRLDVFPGGDVGARRGLERLLGERAPIDRIVERAGDRRGILYFYALAAQLLERGLIHPAAGQG